VFRRLAPLVLVVLLFADGCAGMGPAAAPRRLPLGDLLLVGFRGTTVEGNDELRALICDVRVGGSSSSSATPPPARPATSPIPSSSRD
jgi:hypothetical protein